MTDAFEVRKTLEAGLLAMPDVVGVSHTKDKIIVYTESEPNIPSEIAGYPVQFVKAGHVVALQQYDRTLKYRPCPGSVSVGHYLITAGTLGTFVIYNGQTYGLSNNHVLANGDSIQFPSASKGDAILQPGKYDNGRNPEDIIGYLDVWRKLDAQGNNLVDAALFKPVSPDVVLNRILALGTPVGVRSPRVGERVIKAGRTSGLNEDTVTDIDATIKVDYGNFTAQFLHQIVTGPCGKAGDSGSALISKDTMDLVGLLFAGSETITIHNHAPTVFQELGVEGGLAVVPSISSALLPLIVGGFMLSPALKLKF